MLVASIYICPSIPLFHKATRLSLPPATLDGKGRFERDVHSRAFAFISSSTLWFPSLFCSFLCLHTFNPLSTIIRAIGYFETDTNFAEVTSAAVGNKVLGCTQRYAHMYAHSTSVFRIQERQILEIEFTTHTSGGINIKKRRILLLACYHRC